MSSQQPTLDGLAARAYELAKAITTYMNANELVAPSFAADSPNYPPSPEIQGPRLELLTVAADLYQLAMGANDFVFLQPPYVNMDIMSLDVLNQFDFFSAVPLTGSASYADISKATKLPESVVRRILNWTMIQHIFFENADGRVVHTAITAAILQSPNRQSWLAHWFQEFTKGSVHQAESLRRFTMDHDELSEEVLESAFAIADVGGVGYPTSFWEYLDGEVAGKPRDFRSKRFAEAMQVVSMAFSANVSDLLKACYPWEKLGEATVVDVGGSSGQDAIILARLYPKLNIVVQDLGAVELTFTKNIPADVKPRIRYEVHDFFNPQTTSADIYFLKMILHDWPDKYGAKILAGLADALRDNPKARIIICDVIQNVPASRDGLVAPIPTAIRKTQSVMDLAMLGYFNAKERSIDGWNRVISQASEQLELKKVTAVPGAVYSILEIGLR